MKKELSIKPRVKNKFVLFFVDYWWISIITGVLSFMFCGLPNFLNANKVEGVIARTYTGNFHAHAYGGNSVDFDAVYIILEDSSQYHSSAKHLIPILSNKSVVGERVTLKYVNNRHKTAKRLTMLKYKGEVILDNVPELLIILYLSFLWFAIGGIGELVRIWKSV